MEQELSDHESHSLSAGDQSAFRDQAQVIVNEAVVLISAKNADYGDAYKKHGLTGILIRLSDKALRLDAISGKKALVVEEGARDTLLDMLGYCVLGLMEIDEE